MIVLVKAILILESETTASNHTPIEHPHCRWSTMNITYARSIRNLVPVHTCWKDRSHRWPPNPQRILLFYVTASRPHAHLVWLAPWESISRGDPAYRSTRAPCSSPAAAAASRRCSFGAPSPTELRTAFLTWDYHPIQRQLVRTMGNGGP